MDLNKIIRELRDERSKLDRILNSLEQLTSSASSADVIPSARFGRRPMAPEAREEISRRMKRYWASRRDATSGASS